MNWPNLRIFKTSSERYNKGQEVKDGWGKWYGWRGQGSGGRRLFGEDKREQSFVILLRVTQASGRLLPIGGFTSTAMAWMLYEIAGVTPREEVILTDQEVVVELEIETPIMEVSRTVHGLYQWDGQSIFVDSLVAWRDSIKEVVKQKITREKEKEIEGEHHRIRDDQHECEQHVIEILENGEWSDEESRKYMQWVHTGISRGVLYSSCEPNKSE